MVAMLLRVSWRAVSGIVTRVVAELAGTADRLDGLRKIDIDEIAYRKGHRYLLAVTDHETGRLAWAAEGRNAATLRAFFDALGEDRVARLTHVSADGAEWIHDMVREKASQAVICLDPFHVVKWTTDALDALRRRLAAQFRSSGRKGQAATIKHTRWALIKNPEDLTGGQRTTIASIAKDNKQLYRGYLMKEQLRLRHVATPSTVTHLLLTDRLVKSSSVKGDQEPRHHPLVLDFFRHRLAPQYRERGYDRCSEAAALSDALYAEDARRRSLGEPPITLEEARTGLFGGADIVTYRVRESGDPVAATTTPPCLSCAMLSRHFGFRLKPRKIAGPAGLSSQEGAQTIPERFPAEVADVLRGEGWSAGRYTDAQVASAVDVVCGEVGRNGARIEALPAAAEALSEFGGLHVVQDGPGRDVRRRPFAIDPTQVAATAETLADLGKLLDTKLFPIGMEGDHDSVLAIDEAGRVFALDHAGVWYLGDSVDAALIALVTGTQPPRLDAYGNW